MLDSGILYFEDFTIYETSKEIQRTAYDVFSVIGFIGGISQFFTSIAAFFLVRYS